MRDSNDRIREMWAGEFGRIRAYAFRTVQGILAGDQTNPIFPSSDTIEEIASDGIAEAYQTTMAKSQSIADGNDSPTQRKVFLAFVRNACRNAIRKYRRRHCPNLEQDPIDQTTEETDGAGELLSSLPRNVRKTAELFAEGKSQAEIAETLAVDRTTIYRRQQKLRELLGYRMFCRWVESALT